MILEASQYAFEAPTAISRARRVLIKPCAIHPSAYPVSTSPKLLATIIEGIRKVSDADIVILEGTPDGSPVQPIYQALKYNFPRVLMLDVKDSIWVEVENPLTKPLMVPTFWVPNVILSSDYLIAVSPLKVVNNQPHLTLMNLLSLLPSNKYSSKQGWDMLYSLGMEKVIADLYFTLPFDLGIIEGRQIFTSNGDDPTKGRIEEYGKIFVGEPFQVDSEVTEFLNLKAEYLDLIKVARIGLET
ncbi:MAG: DUF362 domain-containing protein [Dehalococcoidales bacterium]|nr:DUF362 domain-containing protein [Dehalococcoidales bacterium]